MVTYDILDCDNKYELSLNVINRYKHDKTPFLRENIGK